MKWIGRILYLILLFMVASFVSNYASQLKHQRYYEAYGQKELMKEDFNKDTYLDYYFSAVNTTDYLKNPIYNATSNNADYPFDFSMHSARSSGKGYEDIHFLLYYFDTRDPENKSNKMDFIKLGHIKNEEAFNENPGLTFIKVLTYFEGTETPIENIIYIRENERTPVPVTTIQAVELDGKTENMFTFQIRNDKGQLETKTSKKILKVEFQIEDHSNSPEQNNVDVPITKFMTLTNNDNGNMEKELLVDTDNDKLFYSNNFNGNFSNYDLIENYKNDNLVIKVDLTLVNEFKNAAIKPFAIFIVVALIVTYLLFFFKPTMEYINNKKRGINSSTEEVTPRTEQDAINILKAESSTKVIETKTVNEEIEQVKETEELETEVSNEEEDLSKLNMAQLTKKAKELNLTGYSYLRKAELIELIKNSTKE